MRQWPILSCPSAAITLSWQEQGRGISSAGILRRGPRGREKDMPLHSSRRCGGREIHQIGVTRGEIMMGCSHPAPPSFPYVYLHVSPDPVCKVLSFMPGDSPQAGVEGSCSPEASAAISACAAPSAGSPGRWSVPSSLGAGCGRRRQSAEAALGQRSHSSAGQRWGH